MKPVPTLVCALCLSLGAAAATADLRDDYRRPTTIPFPKDAPYNLVAATLGKMLFFDARLSGAQNMSCQSCHDPSFGWETPVERAVGAMNEPLGRHAPTILNQAFVESHFWDGRAATLEEQARGPIEAPQEMNADLSEVVRRLGAIGTYRDGFERAFPGEGLTGDTVLAALATFQRTVVSGWSPFDRWVEGDDTAISEPAKRGFAIFNGKAGCSACHSGWNMSDEQFHDIGLATDDIGRAGVDPDDPYAMHAFKTPGLRNISHRAPYTHTGQFHDLESLVYHYMSGGIGRPSLSPLMKPFHLDEGEMADLIAFLETLTADTSAVPLPILPTR